MDLNDTPPITDTPGTIAYEIRRRLPTLLISGLIAFALSWYNAQRAEEEVRFRLAAVEAKCSTNAENITKNSDGLQQLSNQLVGINHDQTFILQQLQELRMQQEGRKGR